MAGRDLAGVFDGGPHGDPRESEFEELLNDGEEEEKQVGKEEEEDWSDAAFDKDGEARKRPTPKPEEKEEEEEEKEPTADKEKEVEEDKEEEKEEEGKKAAEKEEEEDPKTKYQKIPYDRFKRELLKRKELALRAVQAEERARALEERMAAFERAAASASDPEPDRNVDPFAHQEWRIRQLELKAKGETQPPPKQRSAQFQTFLYDAYKESADEFRVEHPDFDEAYTFALQQTAAQIQRQYPTATPEQINYAIRELEIGEVNSSLQRGVDPAERVYGIAKAMGYKGKEGGNGKEMARKDRIVDALATETAKKKAASLAAKGSPDTRKPLTIDDVEDMSNEELTRFMDRNSGRVNPLKP